MKGLLVELASTIDAFAPVFAACVAHALVLLIGAILAPGIRTVTAVLRVVGLGHEHRFHKYHRVLSHARWSPLKASRLLLGLLIEAFAPAGLLIMGLDDTLERRRGARSAAKGIYRDPVRSSHGYFVKAQGLRLMSQGMLIVAVVGWLAFLLGGEAAAFTRVFDTLVAAGIATVVFFVLPTWNVARLAGLFSEWCAAGRSALAAVAAQPKTGLLPMVDNPENRERQAAFTGLYHACRRFARAVKVAPMEPNSHESPWPLDALPGIVDAMDRTGLALLTLQSAANPMQSGDFQQVERYGEWFGGLAVGNRVSVPQPADGPLRRLWNELDRLESLVLERGRAPKS